MKEVFNKFKVFPKEFHDEKYFKELPVQITASDLLNVDFINMRPKLDFLFEECGLSDEDKINIHKDIHKLFLPLIKKLDFGYFKTKKIKKFNKNFPNIKDSEKYYKFFCDLFEFNRRTNDIELISNYYSCLLENVNFFNLKSYKFLSDICDYDFYFSLENYIFNYFNVTKNIIYTEEEFNY